MGNAGCGCGSRNINVVIPNTKKVVVFKRVENKDSYDTIALQRRIDFKYCKDKLIGPYFLQDLPQMFDKAFNKMSLMKLKFLLNEIEYSRISKKGDRSNLGIDYELIINSDQITKLFNKAKYKNETLADVLIYCPSQMFRLVIYNILLERYNGPFYKLANQTKTGNTPSDDDYYNSVKTQIEHDLHRTCPKSEIFQDETFVSNFKTVLLTLAMKDKELGYVQGMNFIVAFLLMLTGNNKDLTLIMLTNVLNMSSNIFKVNFRHVLTKDFTLLFCYNTMFKEILFRKDKEIYDILQKFEIDEFVWVSKWIQTLFTLNFSFEVSVKLWDIIIAYGIDTIIPIICSILDFFRQRIIKLGSIEDFLQLCDCIYKLKDYDYSRLINHIIKKVKAKDYEL